MNGLHVDRGMVYESDVATLKKYREDYYRITLHRQIRRAGYEAIDGEEEHRSGKKNYRQVYQEQNPEFLSQHYAMTGNGSSH